MTPERLQKIRKAFEDLVDFGSTQRDVALRDRQRDDPTLAMEVEALLSAYDRRAGFIEQPVSSLHSLAGEESEPDLSGKRVGSYELLREIGRGGMGTVYEGVRVDGTFRKRVAIKVIRATLLTASVRDRFNLERQILAGLDHPGIARILDGGTTEEGRPYFVMEYVGGVPIDDYCSVRKLSLNERLTLFLRICSAVQYAHDHLVVHRDLKPGNILVTDEGGIKLLDFGIAKMLADPTDTRASRATSDIVLTPEYASPEQVLGKPVTAATDVYLLGLLLYELLTGWNPIYCESGHTHDLMRAICEEEPVRPSVAAGRVRKDGSRPDESPFARHLKGELDNIILTALQKDPLRRYSSVEHLSNDIERYRTGRPVVAQGDRLSYRASKFLRRNLIAVTAASVIFVSLTAGIVVSLAEARLARDETRTAEQQRQLAQQRQSEAESERLNAEKRYGDLRSLATTLLFDLHDGVHDLAGYAPAQKLVLSKAQQYLETLSKESGNDLQVQRELATAYEKTGDLQREAIGQTGGKRASLKSYRKAVELRKAILKHADASPQAQSELAFSIAKAGDGYFFSGDTKQALENYEQALKLQQPIVASDESHLEFRKVLGYIQYRRCAVLASAGDAVHAEEACHTSIDNLQRATNHDTMPRRWLAATNGALGRLLYNLNRVPESFSYLHESEGLFESLAAEQPNSTEFRRLGSSIQLFLGEALLKQNDRAGGMSAYNRAIESMRMVLWISPGDEMAPTGLAYMLTRMASQLKIEGDVGGAEKEITEAMEFWRTVAERRGAGPLEWNNYAAALLRCDFEALRKPAKGLQFALRASKATKDSNASFLDTLAWAYYLTGDRVAAVETERKALNLVSATNASGRGLRQEIEQNLVAFESGSAR